MNKSGKNKTSAQPADVRYSGAFTLFYKFWLTLKQVV